MDVIIRRHDEAIRFMDVSDISRIEQIASFLAMTSGLKLMTLGLG